MRRVIILKVVSVVKTRVGFTAIQMMNIKHMDEGNYLYY